jgi:holo-[acyl-carrier protein] synthase
MRRPAGGTPTVAGRPAAPVPRPFVIWPPLSSTGRRARLPPTPLRPARAPGAAPLPPSQVSHPSAECITQSLPLSAVPGQRLCVGIDTVALSGLRESLAAFGDRFVQRLFTVAEQADARRAADGGVQRLAARFAAKEAAIKAFGLGEVGVDWRDIEVVSRPDGAPELQLHGRARRHAQGLGVQTVGVSLSHDGEQACAVVVALVPQGPPAA